MNQTPAVAETPSGPTYTHEVASHKHGQPLATCRLDPTGRYAFAGALDLNAYRWDLETGTKTVLKGNQSWVRCIDFHPTEGVAVTADWAGTLCWWRTDDAAKEPKPIATLTAHAGSTRWVRYSPDGRQFATCGNDGLVKLWSADDRKLVWEAAGHERHPYAVAFHPGGEELVSQDLMGHVKVWSRSGGKELRGVHLKIMTGYDNKFAADMGGARDMSFNADGSVLGTAGISNVKNSFAGVQDPILVLVDVSQAKELRQLKVPTNFQGVAWGVRLHADGYIMGCGANRTGKGALWFWDGEKEQPFHTVNVSTAVRGFDLAKDNQRIITAGADGTLRVFSMMKKMG